MSGADFGEKEPHEIINFRHRRDRGTGIVRGRTLLDRNARGQTGDMVHIWFFHFLEELLRVGGKALEVAALAFRVDRVERER